MHEGKNNLDFTGRTSGYWDCLSILWNRNLGEHFFSSMDISSICAHLSKQKCESHFERLKRTLESKIGHWLNFEFEGNISFLLMVQYSIRDLEDEFQGADQEQPRCCHWVSCSDNVSTLGIKWIFSWRITYTIYTPQIQRLTFYSTIVSPRILVTLKILILYIWDTVWNPDLITNHLPSDTNAPPWPTLWK